MNIGNITNCAAKCISNSDRIYQVIQYFNLFNDLFLQGPGEDMTPLGPPESTTVIQM